MRTFDPFSFSVFCFISYRDNTLRSYIDLRARRAPPAIASSTLNLLTLHVFPNDSSSSRRLRGYSVDGPCDGPAKRFHVQSEEKKIEKERKGRRTAKGTCTVRR